MAAGVDHAFVLGTGRCGTRTWAAACRRIANWTTGHESRNRLLAGRLDYPDGHIEVDNRLVWFLGSLDRRYGDAAVYVHLTRDPEAVAASLAREPYGGRNGIMPAWHGRIVRTRGRPADRLAAARLYVATVADNVELFLRDKTRVVRASIEDPHEAFGELWELLGAEGDQAAAHRELDIAHGAS